MALAEFPRHRFTVEEYHRMGETGLLQPDLRVELIEGEVIDMAPIGPDHMGTVNYLNAMLNGRLGSRAVIQVQGPARLSDITEPEPDLLVLLPRHDFYRSRHAEPRDIVLAIEVAKTSLRFDRDVKLPLYGRAGVLETWLVDLVGGAIIVATSPSGDGYQDVRTAKPGESLEVMGLELDVASVLGLT
jgi:Uma2 family endonuclease